LIQNKILNPVASYIISNRTKKGDTIFVTAKAGDLIIETKKAKIKSPIRVKPSSQAKV
jgi:ATP-dependent Clp protease ATP-binding subunit ClpA